MRVLLLTLLIALPPGLAQEKNAGGKEPKKLTARALSRAFDREWQQFVKAFRSEQDTRKRLALIDRYGDRANELLKPYVGEDTIRRVLPTLVNVRILDMTPTFLGVAREHPKDEIKATALLHFAEYLGHNRRSEECQVTLNHLRKKYGKLRFRRTTFAGAADEAGYYFQNLAVGCVAPATTGQDVDGTTFSVSDYQGKVVMLRFWGDWCPACRAMYPYEREITKRYRNRPFALIGVNSDSRRKCREAQQKAALTWRSFWDGGNTGGTIANLYQIEDWPRIIIIDSKGVIRMNAKGLDERYVSRLLDRLIKEAEQSEPSTEA